MLMIIEGEGDGRILTLTSDIDNIITQETPVDCFYTDYDICKLLNKISKELGLSIRFYPYDDGVYITGDTLTVDCERFYQLTAMFRDRFDSILFREDWE